MPAKSVTHTVAVSAEDRAEIDLRASLTIKISEALLAVQKKPGDSIDAVEAVSAALEVVLPYARQATLAEEMADKWMGANNDAATWYRRSLFTEAALQEIASQAICYGMSATEDELRQWLKHISETAEPVLAKLSIGATNHENFVDYVRGRNQTRIWKWVLREFTGIPGVDPTDPLQRAGRFLEEAIELYQAVARLPITHPNGDMETRSIAAAEDYAHRQVAYVFGRPAGEINQEIGGVMVTLNALAEMLGMSIAKEERLETARVLAKPPGHFRKRQEEKRDAGF